MAMIPSHIVDDIMQTSRIEEVIGEFVNLKRAGSNLKGLSPFTDEKTPSFVVSPAKQIFKCFSTGKGGTVVTFLMEKEHFSYPEALRWLADKYGIQIPEDKPLTPEEQEAISERESLHIINEFAQKHFVETMHNTDEGKTIGLSYFVERGFRPEIIEKFQLGFCSKKSDAFTKAALDKGYKLEYLEKIGLTKTKEDRSFDFFRGRVMFPIHSVSGRVLGFGGRTLKNDKKVAKYFNSPESLIYNKSQILYGLYFAKSDIIKYDSCYLCEGYTDVISMYQAGIQNVVSSSGTSLTREQIRLIKRYTNNITILYDGDAAGIKASFRGIDLILEEGLNVKVVLFPDVEDPDSFAKAHSTTEIEEYIKEHQQDFISFKADILLESEGDDPIRRAQLIKDIAHSVSLIPDQITRNVFIPEVAKRFEINEDVIWSEVAKDRQDNLEKSQQESLRKKRNEARQQQQQQAQAPEDDPYAHEPNPFETEAPPEEAIVEKKDDHYEFDLMRILVKYGPLALTIDQLNEHGEPEKVETSVAEFICHELHVDELTFDTPVFNRMHKVVADSLAENVFLKPTVFLRMEDQDIVKFVTQIELEDIQLSPNWEVKHKILTPSEKDKINVAAPKSTYTFKLSKVMKRIAEIQKELPAPGQEDEHTMDLLAEQANLERVKIFISNRLDRVNTH
ncbi:MAG: DNA primase [Fluviicola sp. XM-24bin1]|nr:MAG: DNA primase [Fluviicola sp. XM-24bin1]